MFAQTLVKGWADGWTEGKTSNCETWVAGPFLRSGGKFVGYRCGGAGSLVLVDSDTPGHLLRAIDANRSIIQNGLSVDYFLLPDWRERFLVSLLLQSAGSRSFGDVEKFAAYLGSENWMARHVERAKTCICRVNSARDASTSADIDQVITLLLERCAEAIRLPGLARKAWREAKAALREAVAPAEERLRHAESAAFLAGEARAAAIKYGLLLPKLPDTDLLIARVKPGADAEAVLNLTERAINTLVNASECAEKGDAKGLQRYVKHVTYLHRQATYRNGQLPSWIDEKMRKLKP